MDGLIVRLLEDRTGSAGRWFWPAFGSIRADLDRMCWCFDWQPWMGAPDDYDEKDCLDFEGIGRTSMQLWRPGALGRYAHEFAEESIQLWAIEPTRDDPARLAAEYQASAWGAGEAMIERHARVWLIYTDSTCWEIYARKTTLLARVRESLQNKPGMSVHRSRSDRRGQSFGDAGLSATWRAINGKYP